MADNWTTAFGRYLRTLRERRGHSLQDVCSLSQAFTETLNKGYLSRCENGHQSLAFTKLIPLSRIYEIRADALLERLELDMELDRVGGVDTDGRSYEELLKAGAEAINKGYVWDAYGLLRDSIVRAHIDAVSPQYRDRGEEVACAYMNCATAARRLGRESFAQHEYRAVAASSAVGPNFQPSLYLHLSNSHRICGDSTSALEYCERALVSARGIGDAYRAGNALSARALLASDAGELAQSAAFYQKAHDAFRRAGRDFECTRTLNNLGQTYFCLGRFGAARRALGAAGDLSKAIDHPRATALGMILMGEIDLLEKHPETAIRRWKEAAEIARRLNDKTLRFKAEFYLFKYACESNDAPSARALHRRLRKLAFWVPATTPELAGFRQITSASKLVAS